MTNRESLRNLCDAELAAMLIHHKQLCGKIIHYAPDGTAFYMYHECLAYTVEWLGKEV